MRLLQRASILALLLVACAPRAFAEEGKDTSVNGSRPETPRRVLTGKERLGPKWTDEQRIDNCHVPFDKRGGKSRPDTCPNTPSS